MTFSSFLSLLLGALLLSSTASATEQHKQKPKSNPSLAVFVSQIISNHPDILAAKAKLSSARSSLSAADRAVYNPEIEFGYEDSDSKTKTIGIAQTIDWGDLRGSRTAQANAKLSQAKARYEITSQAFIKKLLKSIAEVETTHGLSQLSEKSLTLMRGFKRVAERRFKAGDLNQAELNLARLAYSQVQMDYSRSLSNKIEAEENIRALIGRSSVNLPALPNKFSKPILAKDLDAFLQKLPSIRLQLAELDAVKHQISIKKSETAWNPTVSVTAGSVEDNSSNQKDSVIGFNLSIPLNIRNNFKNEVNAAHQDLIAQEQLTHMSYRSTRANLKSTKQRYQNLLNAWRHWREEGQESGNEQLALIQQLWEHGEISATEHTIQIRQTLDAIATGLELRNQLWHTAFDWMAMTATIDAWLGINLELTKGEK